MNSVRRILAATDFSSGAAGAIAEACGLARRFGAEVVLVHAVPEIPIGIQGAILKKVDEALKGVRDEVERNGVQVSGIVTAFGKPYEVIVDTASRQRADWVVVGAREREAIGSNPLGTTAEKVVRLASEPVWVVPSSVVGRSIGRILCAIDFSDPSRVALSHAAWLAGKMGASFTVLHVEEDGVGYPNLPAMGDPWPAPRAEGKGGRREVEEFISKGGVGVSPPTVLIRKGRPEVEIVQAVKETQADLLIMGTFGRTGLQRLLMGNTAEKVIRAVPCALLAVKAGLLPLSSVEGEVLDIETHYRRGKDLVARGFYEEALRQLTLCLVIDPEYAAAYRLKAEVYDRMGKSSWAKVLREEAQLSGR